MIARIAVSTAGKTNTSRKHDAHPITILNVESVDTINGLSLSVSTPASTFWDTAIVYFSAGTITIS
jgi:hypothetical protein